MANRSDFMSATLPRAIKRMLTLDGSIDNHEIRKLWIDAHAHAKRCKMRQNSSPAGRSSSAADVPDTE